VRRTEIFIFRAKIVIAFLKHQHLPFFVLCVGQTAVSSYYLRDLYGELLLHSSCLPFHAEFISLELIRSLKQYNWSSLLHTIPSSPFINSILRGRAVYLFASRAHEPLCIVLIPSRFCCHHPVHIATTSRIITHRDSTITIDLLPHLGRSASTYYQHRYDIKNYHSSRFHHHDRPTATSWSLRFHLLPERDLVRYF
jgi:hypothetical protein